MADVFAHASARGVELRLDGTEVQVRRPPRGQARRRAFVSGKKKQNTKKATVITDEKGRTLRAGEHSGPAACTIRPRSGPRASPTCSRGIPASRPRVDAGYRGLAKEFPDQVQAPPLAPKKDAPPEDTPAWEAERHRQSPERICVEHANAEHKQCRVLQRHLGRREDFNETCLAVAGLVSDRAAER